MPETCPQCGAATEAGANFCTACGAPLSGPPDEVEAPPEAEPADAPPVTIEVETSRSHKARHASQLRFRASQSGGAGGEALGLHLSVRLSGGGRLVEQEASDGQQSCELPAGGEPFVFSFPFRGLIPGEYAVEELRLRVVHPARPGEARVFELPDRSLYVRVADPSAPPDAPGVVINVKEMYGSKIDAADMPGGTINVEAMYGSDLKIGDLLARQARPDPLAGEADVRWAPIRLRPAGTEEVAGTAALPGELRVRLGGDAVLELVRIPPGRFVMGSSSARAKADEKPAHEVAVRRGFYLGRFPVTQGQYEALVGENPAKFPGESCPVDNVSWADAKEFCRRLRAHLTHAPEAVAPDVGGVEDVSLPTEAEWEYACRAGAEGDYAFGDDRARLIEYGWFDKNSARTTHAVGQLRPNAWGLFDMHGNVWEWCEDAYAPNYAAGTAPAPESAIPSAGPRRALRGGSWSYYARQCRSAARHAAEEAERTANYGFRVVLRVGPAGPT